VLVADLAQALQVALAAAARRWTRPPADDDGGDRRCIVQRDQAFQIVGEFGAVLRQADAERVARRIVRVADVVDAASMVPNILRLALMPPTEMPRS